MQERLIDLLEDSPIIAAVKDDVGLKKSLASESKIIFILYGDICSIADIVKVVKDANKVAMVHIDLITGLSGKDIALDFLKQKTLTDGIITTKHALIKHAKELGFYTVLRFFIIDSMALLNVEKQSSSAYPDVIEILPGIMPKIIKQIKKITKVPVIAGGLIRDKEDVMAVLSSGAVSVSSTNQDVWFM